ncbi:MAG: GAF domain-containing protein [Candidatus Eisenbacteria bacterium]
MNWTPASVAPLVGAVASLATVVAAASRRGAPAGRGLYTVVLLCTATLLVWLSAFLGEAVVFLRSEFHFIVVLALLLLAPSVVALSIRLGQPGRLRTSGGLGAVLVASVSSLLVGLWIQGGTESSLRAWDDGSLFLELAPGPARATAVCLLLAGCYAIVRFQAAIEAARRAGIELLGRGLVGPLFATVALVLTTSQLLLYGSLPLELVAIGSLVIVPTTLVTWPMLVGRASVRAALPVSSRVQTSGLLLLGLGLFLVSLAALGQVVHEIFPERGILWFRYGGTAVLLAFALLSLVPSVRGPLSDYFDRSLYAQRWDFRHEWRRANRACQPASSLTEIVHRAREFLDEILGPTAVALWVPGPDGEPWVPVSSGSVELGDLRADNPIRTAVANDHEVVELVVDRPHSFEDIPAVVENLLLVESRGFRVFLGMNSGDETFALLGLAPPAGFRLDREHRVLLENFGGQLANTLRATLGSGAADGRHRSVVSMFLEEADPDPEVPPRPRSGGDAD